MKEIENILKKINDIKIAVYGDFCLDAHWVIDPMRSEISVETGLKCEAVKNHWYTLGGASNVVANLAALKPASIFVIGLVGEDIFGREILRQFRQLGIDLKYLVTAGYRYSTPTYGKRYIDGKEIPRIDFGMYNKKSKRIEESLLDGIRSTLSSCDVVIFNQQIPGCLSEYFIRNINELFEEFDCKIVLMDSRHYGNKIKNTYIKVNVYEAASLNNIKIGRDETVELTKIKEFGKNLFSLYNKPVFITRGARGIAVFDRHGFHEVLGIHLNKKLDITGAGDTMVSSLALSLAVGFDPKSSAEFANLAASVVVQKLFVTGTASPKEILNFSKKVDYIYEPELAENYRKARYIDDSEIEICYPIKTIPLGKLKYAVFDNDGTISTLREGWEKTMETVMMHSILEEKYDSVSASIFFEIQNSIVSYINNSSGILTLEQMQALVEMVKYYGFVPKKKILDSFGYKKRYNTQLMKFVNQRINKINKGELDRKDFILKGAVTFLTALKKINIRLYLVSGTDHRDVLNEAKVLGYAEFFNGGIFGALNDLSKFSKKMIIEKIIADFKLKGSDCVVFGDGPVEMRESRRVGGLAVGVASDEKKRFGLNYYKRTRLIKGGAHIIIPDFTQLNKIMDLLF